MSRETDSSSSGPQGRGGAAYPSGTPPYGSRQYPSLHPSQDAPEGAPEPAEPSPSDEPRTETTLTTRIRINIPGSRPIPPVVMRTPVGDADVADVERTGSIPRPGSPAADGAPAGSDAASAAEARTGAATTEPAADKPAREKSGSDWFAPRKAPTNTSVAGGGTAGGADGIRGAEGAPPRADLPYFSDGPQRTGDHGAPRPDDFGPGGSAGPASGDSRPTPDLGIRTPGPSGPTTGPVTGTSPLTPDLGGPGGPGSGPMGSGPGPVAPGGPSGTKGAGGPVPRMSDDTAVLTPQFAAPAPAGPGGNVSGDTLTSGIPVIPPERRGPSAFPNGPRPGAGAGGSADPASRVPGDPMGTGPAGPGGSAAAPAPRSEPAPAPAKKKGRSKLVLLGAAAVALLGVAYGAGLLMNHSDVPKGTTVLGVDIGGGTKEEGVTKLDAALGKRAVAPIQLSVDGKKTQLAPDKAGLALDSQETVRSAAGSDYNPVSVIGSLFGGKRAVDPVIPVDEEKLGVALTDLAGVSGSANDGTIKFEPGKAVAVPGKSGKALDVNQSMTSVRDAYRAQVQTGRSKVVQLPVTTREPTIGQAEIDRAMKEFAKPAMSGLVTIKAGAKQIQFGPARSLPQILSMVPVNGRLVEHYDKKAIETLCDGVFDGIMITKGDGKKHQLSADDVAQAMQTALLGKTPAERTTVIGLDGNG
ncbi:MULTISPECIES: peptidoglycan binding domain-containing protein [unclassified Streptomyces]|uniref:peptidoglycan binding domain-containing protein n=1 Tax=unclassified Streptomyces TaxID=2593676 RepID=UPI003699A4FA